MIKRNLMTTLAVAAMALLAAACADDYDDSALWDKVNDHEERLAALEKWQEQSNQSIAAMQELLNTTDMITGVTAVTEDGETVGYTITFLHSDPITIYNGAKGADGEDGADGQTPQIGLAQAAEGNWYWTLNGETLTDADGGKLTASRLLTKGYSYDNNTYTVYTADGLKAWAEAAQSDFSLNCILAADITLPTVAEGESNWTPIGTHDHYYNRYTGTFDGGGHTITGLTINQSGTDHVGLFGCIGGRGTVKNLTLENVNIIGHDNVGGVAGYNDMGATITACYWSNYDGNGIGANYGTGTHTKVDGTTVTWQTAVDAMNAALQYSEWRYELTGALPTLKKQ